MFVKTDLGLSEISQSEREGLQYYFDSSTSIVEVRHINFLIRDRLRLERNSYTHTAVVSALLVHDRIVNGLNLTSNLICPRNWNSQDITCRLQAQAQAQTRRPGMTTRKSGRPVQE